jgi:hypothetical protein
MSLLTDDDEPLAVSSVSYDLDSTVDDLLTPIMALIRGSNFAQKFKVLEIASN